MKEPIVFPDREAFRDWLTKNGMTSEGQWLLFGKKGGPRTLSAGEALEEALCFGWIDGQMKRLDEYSYKKYFAPRRPRSKWSLKNKQLAEKLQQSGRMTELGREKIAEAQANGRWDQAAGPTPVTEAQIAQVAELLKPAAIAYENFQKMSPSVQKTYTRAYLDSKTDEGRKRRLAWMKERLTQNLPPM